jgi:hypothetical protein
MTTGGSVIVQMDDFSLHLSVGPLRRLIFDPIAFFVAGRRGGHADVFVEAVLGDDAPALMPTLFV